MPFDCVLVTGGCGFIGSNLVRHLLRPESGHAGKVVNLDMLTYAGNPATLAEFAGNPRYHFVQGDIGDAALVAELLREHRPGAVMHLAAESHVDRSIDGPAAFVQTNIVGTYNLLECVRQYTAELPEAQRQAFRFLHISTDEVYGSLGPEGLFTEATPYDPRSPYSASKAASDHLVLAWHHTYKLPTVITNCSNNYGPFHFPEKLIPLVILNCLDGKSLPIYGKGDNIRDWLYVEDHAKALWLVVNQGVPGETYNVGGNNERTNLQIVEAICDLLDELAPERRREDLRSYRELMTFVADRPGHDKRYAIDASKLKDELGWRPAENFDTGIRKTVRWYLDNAWWWRPIREGKYSGERLGRG